MSELAELTGLEPRTIRHYIAEGLLRGPESLGRKAHYTNYHLSRLNAIRQLREQGNMSIAEIRRYFLMAADDEEIHVVPVYPGAMASLTHLDLDNDEFADPDEIPDFSHSIRRSHQPQLARVIAAMNRIADRRIRSEGRTRTLHEFEITPEITLSVRGDYEPGELRQFERLAAALQSLLLGGVREDDND